MTGGEHLEAGFVRVGDGARLAYRFDGLAKARVVVLAHSLGADMSMWDRQVDALAGTFHVLRYDARGHGASEAPPGAYGIDRLGRDAFELLDALDLEDAVFCGVSMGGMVGQWLGARAQGRLGALVLANTSARMEPASAWQERIAAVRAGGVAAVALAVVGRWFTPAFAARMPQAVARALQGLRSTSIEGYVGCCCAIRDMDQRPSAPSVGVPTLVIAGRHDLATPPDHARFLADAIPGARYAELDAAHLSNVEAADAFNDAFYGFLRQRA